MGAVDQIGVRFTSLEVAQTIEWVSRDNGPFCFSGEDGGEVGFWRLFRVVCQILASMIGLDGLLLDVSRF